MPTSLTYSTLLTDVQGYLERASVYDTLVYAQLPRLVNLAEKVVCREAQVQGELTPVTSSFTASSAIVPKPDRWRETVSINYGTGTNNNTRNFLYPRAYEYIRTLYPDDTATGLPKYYADYDYNNWLIGPTPAGPYPFEVVFYQNPQYLDSANQTNYWTNYAPEVLLFATLEQAARFLKDKDLTDEYNAQYQRALAALNKENTEKVVDRTSTRRGP